jgi:hypothetical protein
MTYSCDTVMKRTLPFLFGCLLLNSVSCFANPVFTVPPSTAGIEKAVEPFTMAIAGAILMFLGLAGRKRTA